MPYLREFKFYYSSKEIKINEVFFGFEFPKGMRDQVEKIMEIPGGRGSNAKPSGAENPVGWGVKLQKTLRGGSMDVFWKHTILEKKLYRKFFQMTLMVKETVNLDYRQKEKETRTSTKMQGL